MLFCHHCHYVDRVCRTCLSAEKRIVENEPDAMREGGENQFGTRSSHTTCEEGRERGVPRFNWRICVRLEPSLIASPASPVLPIPSLSTFWPPSLTCHSASPSILRHSSCSPRSQTAEWDGALTDCFCYGELNECPPRQQDIWIGPSDSPQLKRAPTVRPGRPNLKQKWPHFLHTLCVSSE